MRIIGERLASGSNAVRAAISARDVDTVIALARCQAEAGANYLDVGAAAFGVEREAEHLAWLVAAVQEIDDIPLSLDCQNAPAIRAAIAACRLPPIWNSLCPAAGSMDEILAILKDGLPCAGVVAVLQEKWGDYLNASERVDLAHKLAASLAGAGLPPKRWIFDPVTLPQSTGAEWTGVTLETITKLRERFPDSSVLCAISNYSYGLRERRPANRAWARQAIDAGADVFLCDPLDSALMQSLRETDSYPLPGGKGAGG